MNLEEQNQAYSNGGGGESRSSKKQKQKKVPQRGLGVAQLEKIRLEEEQKRDVVAVANAINSTTPLPVPLLDFSAIQSSSSVPLPSLSQNPMLKPPPIPSVDSFYLNPQSNGRGGFDSDWPTVPTLNGNAHLHKMWHPYVMSQDGENSSWENGLPLPLSMSLPFESSPMSPLSHSMPSVPQFSQAPAASLMNIPLFSSSPLTSFRIEPPSNQSLYSNISPLWSEEEKMGPLKRPYPFPLDTSLPSFQSKLPRIASRSDESTPFGNGRLFNPDPGVPILQEAPLLPSSSKTEPVLKKIDKENGNRNGDFLTLAPPSVTSPHPSPRFKHSLPNRIVEDPVANSPRSAGPNHKSSRNPFSNPGRGSTSSNQTAPNPVPNPGQGSSQPFFSFIPASKVTSVVNNHSNSNGNGEVRGTVDLNLKL